MINPLSINRKENSPLKDAIERDFWEDVLKDPSLKQPNLTADWIKSFGSSSNHTLTKNCQTIKQEKHINHFKGSSYSHRGSYSPGIKTKKRQKKMEEFLQKCGKLIEVKPKTQRIRTDFLYAHAKINTAMKEQMRNDVKCKRNQLEMSQCTFYPQIIKKYQNCSTTFNDNGKNINIYKRNKVWCCMKKEKINRKKKERIIEETEYTYRPRISVDSSYMKEFNKDKSITNDSSTIEFISRLEKGRKVKSIKDNLEYRKTISIDRSTIRENCNISQKMTSMLMKKLKNDLHSELISSIPSDTDTNK